MKRILLTAVAVFGCACVFAQTQIKVDAPNIVSADEQFNVTFIIEGENRPSSFDWSPGNDFTRMWGPQKGVSSSTSIINGKVTKSSQCTYTYILTPKSTGKFELPAASAVVKGNTITSAPVTIEVLASGGSSSASAGVSSGGTGSGQAQQSAGTSGDVSSKDIFLRFTMSRTSAVIGEPITAELKLYCNAELAGVEGAKFPTFNGFWSQETAAPNSIQFEREAVDGQLYNAALLRRYVLIPQQAGSLTIDPAELVCLVNIRTAPRGNSIFDSFFDDNRTTVRKRITTSPVHVQVKNLPAGAPASFGGGVGNFKISAKLSKDGLKTHEATSLVVTVSGRGNVSLLEAPKIDFPPDLEAYDVKTTTNADKSNGGISGSKTFEYPFIPRSHGEFTIGPIEYSYYDINAGKYVTLTAELVAFNVEKGEAQETVSDGNTLVAPERKGVRTLGEDVRFIVTKAPAYAFTTTFFVGTWYYWAISVALLLIAAVIFVALKGMDERKADVVGSKNRRATKMALGRLKMAEGYLKKGIGSAFYEELHKSLLGFISDKLNMNVEDLSKDNISAQLADAGVPAELSGAYISLLDECEFARYSPESGDDAMSAHYNEAVRVISTLDSAMKRRKTGNAAGKVTLVVAALLAVGTVSKAEETAYLDSLWNAGVSAYTDGQWENCISTWKFMEGMGVVSPELYYNLGNACFKVKDYPHAILYYERVLKQNPSYTDARVNLELANSLIQDKIDEVPEFVLKSWARKLSYTMSSNSWAVISLIMFALSLALALLFVRGESASSKRIGFYGFVVTIIFSILSFSLARWQRSTFMKADYAVIVAPVSSAKSSPSADSSKDLFVLHEGTKVRIIDAIGEWKNISLTDGRQGWIRETDMEVI